MNYTYTTRANTASGKSIIHYAKSSTTKNTTSTLLNASKRRKRRRSTPYQKTKRYHVLEEQKLHPYIFLADGFQPFASTHIYVLKHSPRQTQSFNAVSVSCVPIGVSPRSPRRGTCLVVLRFVGPEGSQAQQTERLACICPQSDISSRGKQGFPKN